MPAPSPDPNPVTLGLIQSACGDDLQNNLDRTIERVRDACRKGAQIICLQELYRGPYFCQVEDAARFDLAEPIPGPSTEAFTALAAELACVLIVPIFERRAAGIYHNSAVVIDADGAILGTYRKMHIPDDPLYFEKYYFTPGDRGYQAYNTRFGRIGVLICWDQWFPEAARLTALQGAEILFYPSAIGWHLSEKDKDGIAQRDAWVTIQRSHAIANGLFVAACNRVGTEKNRDGKGAQSELQFWGSSFVCDPFGVVLSQAGESAEETLITVCDLQSIEETRRGWPFLRDRRVDSYQSLSEQYLDHP